MERAALVAAGPDFPQVLAWITDHDGQPEALKAAVAGGGGVHGARIGSRGSGNQTAPLRYVLMQESFPSITPAARFGPVVT